MSNNARGWVLDRYKDRLVGNIGHNTDLTQYTPEAQDEWRKSLVGQELNAFLSQYGCNTEFGGINVFMCTLGNPDPHIDTLSDPKTGEVYRIRSRLNVIVVGSATDPLVWWGGFEYDDPRIENTKFLAPNGREYINKSVPGSDTQGRYAFLGAPELVARNVYTPSAFVKTDCAHTVHFTPGPRLIVTVPLDKSIEELVCLNSMN